MALEGGQGLVDLAVGLVKRGLRLHLPGEGFVDVLRDRLRDGVVDRVTGRDFACSMAALSSSENGSASLTSGSS
jgi:hypothetical protein